MAAINDTKAGIFEICCDKTGLAYLGVSKGVGVALRSAKSKLSHNKFHNYSLQSEYNRLSVHDYSFDTHLLKDGEVISELLERIKKELSLEDWSLHNDIEIIEAPVGEFFDELTPKNKELVVSHIKKLLNEQNK